MQAIFLTEECWGPFHLEMNQEYHPNKTPKHRLSEALHSCFLSYNHPEYHQHGLQLLHYRCQHNPSTSYCVFLTLQK